MSTVTVEDLPLYAMQLLDEADSDRVLQFVRRSPEAQEELRNIQSDLALLALLAEPQTVPDAMRQRFLSAVAREPRSMGDRMPSAISASALPAVKKPKRNALGWLLPWSGWAVAAGLAIMAWIAHQSTLSVRADLHTAQRAAAQAEQASLQAREASARARTVLETLRAPSAQRFLLARQNTAPAPTARVTYVPSSGSLIFLGSNLDSLPPAKVYELWLIPVRKGAKPVAAGTFKPDARGYASLILPSLPKGIAAGTFGVTMEADGGSETPTLPILLIGS